MNEQMKKIRDELASECETSSYTCELIPKWHKRDFSAGFDAAMERAKVLEETLDEIANLDFEVDSTSAYAASKNPFIKIKARAALAKFRVEE